MQSNFQRDEVRIGLPPAGQRGLIAIDDYLGGTGPGVVLGRHGEAVGAGGEDGQVFSGFHRGKPAVLGQKIGAFADGTHHVHDNLLHVL